MLRLALYIGLGVLLGLTFAPVFTMSNLGILSIAASVGLFGAIIAVILNRMLGTQAQGSIENVIEYGRGRMPWRLLPQAMQDNIADWFRSIFH